MFSMGWYPKPRLQSGTTLVVLVGAGPGSPKTRMRFWGAPQTRPPSAFTVCEVDPSIAVRTSIQQLITLSQRACGTRAGLKPAPTSFATAMCFPSGVCGTLVIRDCPARGLAEPICWLPRYRTLYRAWLRLRVYGRTSLAQRPASPALAHSGLTSTCGPSIS